MEDRHISSDSIVDAIFHLKWKSENAIHTDGFQASRINIWRDFLPPFFLEKIKRKQAGKSIELRLKSDVVNCYTLFVIRSDAEYLLTSRLNEADI